MAERKKAGVFRYIKEAFLFRWNVLLLGGAAAAGLLSGHGDVVLPLIAAGELAYLAGLTTLPRFQAAIDAKAAAETRGLVPSGPSQERVAARLEDLLNQLEPESRRRFHMLHRRCHEMRGIAQGVGGAARSDGRADELRAPGLDRLLWVFLRLLFSQQALRRFLHATDEASIEKQLAELEVRVKEAEARGDERILRSVRDSIATAQMRLENFRKAKNNAEFVGVELDRIEGKIQALTEMSVSNQDPDFISSQVDAVTEGMNQTEDAIRELNHITGLTDEMEGTPPILETDLNKVLEGMSDDAEKKVLSTALDGLPAWFPRWAARLAELYFSGTTSMFVLHGNTFDYVQVSAEKDGALPRFGSLAEFVSAQLFGRWDLVLHYDLARGLRCAAGNSESRLKDMVALANKKVVDLSQVPKTPSQVLAVLDRFVEKNVITDPDKRVSCAVIIDHASYVVPRGDRLSLQDSTHLVTLLNWASSPYVKRLNMAFVLIDSSLSDVSERLTQNGHVAAIEVPLPELPEREAFLRAASANTDISRHSDYSLEEIAKLTAGISLTDLNVLLQSAKETGKRLDRDRFRELKKRLIERQAQGLLEFIEPRWSLDMVVGHEGAKSRLKEDAELLKRGRLDSVPMGYLLCGPVGTGKSFLAQCTAGAIGIPCVQLKNFRSKYVGETEGNLERVLTVLRSMGPVLVMIDEADAMLGNRSDSGDSGVGGRVFGMVAAQMGDTRYRGRILWMLLTARPDLLPIDLKRQGRAEVHIPLFYPTEQSELRHIFLSMAKKVGARLEEKDLPSHFPHEGHLSGADVEGMIGRAWRRALLADADHIRAEDLAQVLAEFLPSTQSLERELQEVAALIECTDLVFLPEAKRKRVADLGGREKLQERLNAIKQLLERN